MSMNEPLPRVGLQIAQGEQEWGKIVLELDAQRTPKTVANFLRYVDSGFFESTIFHRVIANFMVQGGGFLNGDKPKRGEHSPVQNEAREGLRNARGTIAMARTNDPHSATSQFFINVADNDFLDHPGGDGWGYCAFGRVVEGMEVVDKIRQVKTRFNPQMGEDSQPVDPPFIKKAERIKP